MEGDTVETSGVARGPETTFHTRLDELSIRPVVDVERDMQAVRTEIQNQMATWRQVRLSLLYEKFVRFAIFFVKRYENFVKKCSQLWFGFYVATDWSRSRENVANDVFSGW